jgi:tetratricopeptide (TPR) repeat protein
MESIRCRAALIVLAGALVGASIDASQAPVASQAAATKPGNQDRLARIRAELFAGTNRPDDAVRELKEILAVDPGSAEAHMLLGIAYRTVGSPDLVGEAVAELRQALALDPSSVPARYFLAHIYFELGRNERAREELDAGLALAPRSPQFLALLGEVERQLKNPKRALDVLTQALQIDGTSAQAHYYLGLTLLDLGKTDEGIKELEGVVRSGEKRADVYVSLGASYLDAGRFDEGLQTLTTASQIDPARPDIQIQLARAYRLKGQLVKADAQLMKGMPKGPANVASPFAQQRQVEFNLYMELGLLRLQQGQLTAAVSAFRKVLEIDPDHGPTNRQLAEVLLRQGQYSRALEYAGRAEKLGFPLPDDKRKLLQEQLQKQKKEAGGQE